MVIHAEAQLSSAPPIIDKGLNIFPAKVSKSTSYLAWMYISIIFVLFLRYLGPQLPSTDATECLQKPPKKKKRQKKSKDDPASDSEEQDLEYFYVGDSDDDDTDTDDSDFES